MNELKLSAEKKQAILEDIKRELESLDLYKKEFTYKYSKEVTKKSKAIITISPKANQKIQIIMLRNPKEVAWHGVVKKTGIAKYTLEDILIYPQKVTAVTVVTDQEAYNNWLMGLTDEQHENLRLQGHSHVNMSVNPSGTDTNYYKELLSTVSKGFYIFMIHNKRNDVFVNIVDLDDNIFYETADVEVKLHGEENWYAGASKVITENVVQAADLEKKTYHYTPTTKFNTYSEYQQYKAQEEEREAEEQVQEWIKTLRGRCR